MSDNQSFNNIVPKFKIWLETKEGKGILGDGKWRLFKAIQEEGSLMGAIEKLGLSYRTTWNNLRKIEALIGVRLLEHTRGGSKGGTTGLTPDGLKIIKAFDNFHSKVDKVMNDSLQDFLKELKS